MNERELHARLVSGAELADVAAAAITDHLNMSPRLYKASGHYVIDYPQERSPRLEFEATDEFVLFPYRPHPLPGRELQYRCKIHDVYGQELFAFVDVLVSRLDAYRAIDDWRIPPPDEPAPAENVNGEQDAVVVADSTTSERAATSVTQHNPGPVRQLARGTWTGIEMLFWALFTKDVKLRDIGKALAMLVGLAIIVAIWAVVALLIWSLVFKPASDQVSSCERQGGTWVEDNPFEGAHCEYP